MCRTATLSTQYSAPCVCYGQQFFSSVPDGMFILISGFIGIRDYVMLHHVLASNKQCASHWEKNLRTYAHRTEVLFDKFTSVEALCWVFSRKIMVVGFELQFEVNSNWGRWGYCTPRTMKSTNTDNYDQATLLTHSDSFLKLCADGCLFIVRAMVESHPKEMNAKDKFFRTPLHYAAMNNHLDVVQYLCEEGAAMEARGVSGWTSLHWAAHMGHLPVVQYLCKKGAAVEARNGEGNTPLHLAAESGHLHVMQCLCESHGADVEAKDNENLTPIQRAAVPGGHPYLVQYLSESG